MDYIGTLRRKRLVNVNLKRDKAKKPALYKNNRFTNRLWLIILIVASLLCGIYQWVKLNHIIPYNYYQGTWLHFTPFINITERFFLITRASIAYGFAYGFFIMILFLLLPAFYFIFFLIKQQRIPHRYILKRFSLFYKIMAGVALAFLFVYWLHPYIVKEWWFTLFYTWSVKPKETHDLTVFIGDVLIAFSVLTVLFFKFIPKTASKQRPTIATRVKHLLGNAKFSLYLGESTGLLAKRYHGAAIGANQPVTLSLEDSALNVLVLGGIGEGKTTSVINPLLVQLLDQDCGGLIFDVKGNFKRGVMQIANQLGKEVVIIGANRQPMNIIGGLKPDTAAEYLRSALMLHGSGGGEEKVWVNAAASLANNVLGILSFFPQFYTLEGLHRFLYNRQFQKDIQDKLDSLELSEKQQRILDHYCYQYDNVFVGKYEKYKGSVMSTMDEVLSHFVHPDVADSFCVADKDAPSFRDVLDGRVYLVDMLLDDWGMCGKIIYMFIKLRYFNIIKQRQTSLSWDQDRPVFFMCDEYQEVVNWSKKSLSDLNFWDTAREAKNIGIISTQSIASFHSAIGNEKVADTILQNFRQKMCFKTEDRHTISLFEFLLGKVEFGKYSFSRNASAGATKHKDGRSYNEHSSDSKGLHFIDKPVVDSQLFRTLNRGQVVSSLNINGRSMDDVLDTFFVDLR